MPPIQVYTQSPINPAKASGITPQTAAAGTENKDSHPRAVSPSHTSPPTQASNQHSQPKPTPTRAIPSQEPPPPQPGAAPRPPQATAAPPRAANSGAVVGDAAGGGWGGGAAPPAPTAAPQFPGTTYPPRQYHHHHHHHQQGYSWGGGGAGGVNSSSSFGSGYVPQPYQAPTGAVDNGDEEGGLLSSAVRLVKAAGQKLAAAESEVWRRINERS